MLLALLPNQTLVPTDQLPRVLAFALGAVGASALEIVRLYELRRNPPPREIFSWWFWIISFVYSVLGGVMAIIMPATTMFSAFYAGVALPAILSTMAKNRTKRTIGIANERRSAEFINERDRVPYEPPHPDELQAARASRFKSAIQTLRRHADGLFY